jgi:hypothetical protein
MRIRHRVGSEVMVAGALLVVLALVGAEAGLRLLRERPPPPSQREPPRPPPDWRPAVAEKQEAPGFDAAEPEGRVRRLRDFRGKPLFLAFYDERPRSRTLAREFQKIRRHIGFHRLAELGGWCGNPASLPQFLRDTGDRGVAVLVPSKHPARERYGLGELPQAWVLDAAGRVVWAMPPIRVDDVPEGHLEMVTAALRSLLPIEPKVAPLPDPFADVRGKP